MRGQTSEFAFSLFFSSECDFLTLFPAYLSTKTKFIFEGFVEKYNLNQLFKFNTVVDKVTYNETSEKFTVDVHEDIKLNRANEGKDVDKNDGKNSNTFDYVVVATGHFSWPESPYFEGEETFPGQIIHAHE